MNRIDYNDENYYFGGIQEAPFGNPSLFPLRQEDIDKLAPGEGGTGNVDPEQTEVTYTANGVNIIEPSEGFDGMSSVKVTVNVPSAPSVTKFYYSNGFMSESNDTIITKQSYSSGSTLVSVLVGNNVTEIADLAFENRYGLANVEFSESVTSIGDGAFMHCYSLSSITIPNSVKNIGASAFNFCTGLTNVEISEGVTSIGTYAFGNSDNLSSVTIPNSVLEIGDNAFNSPTLNAKFISTTPPPNMNLVFGHLGGGSGSGSSGRTLVIEVPEASLEAYKEALPYYASLDVIVGY